MSLVIKARMRLRISSGRLSKWCVSPGIRSSSQSAYRQVMARDTAGTMLQTFEAVKDAVGLDIPKAIRNVTTGGLVGRAAKEDEPAAEKESRTEEKPADALPPAGETKENEETKEDEA